jgi:outer membrane lipoprotein LolB
VIRYFLLVLLVTQLLACSSVGSIKSDANIAQSLLNTEKVLAIKHWQLLGRLSVRNHRESWLTKLEWKHDVLADDLTLSTSLGGVVARLVYSNAGIAMSDAKGVMQRISDEDLQSSLGYLPPWAHLKYWVRGIPSPKAQLLMSEEQKTGVILFNQDGWDVRLGDFEKVGGIVLPSKIYLSKEGLKIKLVVDEWLV